LIIRFEKSGMEDHHDTKQADKKQRSDQKQLGGYASSFHASS
jgi:hypothetical protein